MSPQIVAFLVVAASLAAWAAFLAVIVLGKRRGAEVETEEREEALVGAAAAAGAPAYVLELEVPEPAPKPRRVEEDVAGVSRRQFLNRSWVTALLIGAANFGMASLDFLWPRLRGGFGTKIKVGRLEEIRNEILAKREPKFVPDGRFYIHLFQGDRKRAEKIPAYKQANTIDTGIVALYRKCVHLGCSVPWCKTAQWYECPCHGSKYSINGEYRDGPAPRSLDRFRVEIVDGEIVVDTSTIITGPPRGTVTSQPQPEGEHCVVIAES